MKNRNRIISIIAILVLTYSLMYFIIPYKHISNSIYIINYVIGLFAIIIQIFPAFNLDKTKKLRSKLYSLPIIKVGLLYLVIQLGFVLLFCVLNSLIRIPLWIMIIIYVVLLAMLFIGIVSTTFYKETIEKQEFVMKNKTTFIDNLKIESKLFKASFTYNPLYKKVEILDDLIQFSDPVSNINLVDLEDEINNQFGKMKQLYSEDKYSEVEEKIDQIIELIKEINFKCKISK